VSSDMDQPDSVIAACIQRFRHQAPAPSEDRSRIPVGKFWWLDPSAQNDLVGSSSSSKNLDIKQEDPYRETTSPKSAQSSLPEQLTQLSCGSSSSGNSTEKETKAIENTDDENRSTRRKSEQSVHHQYFNQDLKIHSVDDVLNLDNYAEKLLQKCDLLLSGYNTTSKERSSRSPNFDFEKRVSEGSKTRIRGNHSAAVRNKSASNSRRPMTVSESQVTFSSYDSDSKSEAASDEISADSDNTDRLPQLLQSRSHTTPRFSRSKLELDLEGESRPVSPLGSSFDANTLTLNWTSTQIQEHEHEKAHEYEHEMEHEYEHEQERNTQLSLQEKKRSAVKGDSSFLNIRYNSAALQAVCAPSIKSTESVSCMTVVTPDNIIVSAGDRVLIPEKKGNSIKFNSAEAEYDTLEPTLSASLVFPAGYKMGRDDRHGSDSFLYVSSSSELDASVRAVSAARLRHSGVSNYDGGDVNGSKSVLRGIRSNGDGRVIESVDGHDSGDNNNENENEKDNERENEHAYENENRSTNFDDDDENRKTGHNDNNSNRCVDDIGNDENDYNESNNDRSNNHDDESLRGSRIIETEKTATITNTHTACNDSDAIPVTSELITTPSVSTRHTELVHEHVHVPLLEADVAPYLDDEITMLLWQRLCTVRSRLRNLKVQDPQL
jgi:hypothetical protein